MPFLQEYTMLDELGKGGFATVYKVRHNELGYIRAIRVLNETVVDASSPTYQKFLRECKVLLRLGNGNHPNIVHIYQPRLLDNKALVEMDYVDGQDITHYLQQKQNFVPVEEVIRMALQMSSALSYCHEDIYRFCMDRDMDNLQDDPNDGSKVLLDEKTRQHLIAKYKVIHNDIHSGNIMRREDGNFVLLDFGLAINGEEVVRSSRRKNGAPEFKAPEKWDDESILTEQSDIYSFGVVLYQHLAGRVPFPYNTHVSSHIAEFELGEAHQKATPPSIVTLRKEFYEKKFVGREYEKDYPQWLEDAILKCLQKNPADRFKNGKDFYEYISNHYQGTNNVNYEMKIGQLQSLNESLTSQVEDSHNTNTSLNKQLNSKQNQLNQTQQILRDTQEQLNASQQKIYKKRLPSLLLLLLFGLWGVGMSLYAWNNRPKEWKKKIEEKEAIIASNNVKIEELNQLISELSSSESGQVIIKKDNDIASLKKEIGKQQDDITRVNNLILQKDQRIKTLESQLSQQKPVDNSAELTNLKRQILQKDQRIRELELLVSNQKPADNSAELKNLKTKIDQKDKRIEELEAQIIEKDREISVLKKY